MELGSELGWAENSERRGETSELSAETGDGVAAQLEFDSTVDRGFDAHACAEQTPDDPDVTGINERTHDDRSATFIARMGRRCRARSDVHAPLGSTARRRRSLLCTQTKRSCTPGTSRRQPDDERGGTTRRSRSHGGPCSMRFRPPAARRSSRPPAPPWPSGSAIWAAPFAEAVPVDDHASPTDRLVAWSGRRP